MLHVINMTTSLNDCHLVRFSSASIDIFNTFNLSNSSAIVQNHHFYWSFNPIQNGMGVQKGPPTNFSLATSTNLGISLQIFLTFSFNSFDRLVLNIKFVCSASLKLLNLNQDHTSKKAVLLVKFL